MNKSDLINALAAKETLTDKKAADIVDLVFGEFTDALRKGDRIEIRGFGSFTVREYGSYTGRNPKSGENIAVKEKKAPFFKVEKN